jgi:hypothetical protein
MIKLLKTKEFEDSQREVTCYQERTPVHLTAGFLPEPMAARRLKWEPIPVFVHYQTLRSN